MSRLLVVEDDPDIAMALRLLLTRAGHQVAHAKDGRTGLRYAYTERPELVILDIGRPGMDGWQVLERLRDVSDVPVLLLTAHGQESDKVRGLRGGADDYLTKPFTNAELVARVEALLRRSAGPASWADEVYDDGVLRIDPAARRTFVAGDEVRLTPTQFRLLHVLVRHADAWLSPNQLLAQVWDDPAGAGPERVKFEVLRLRRKLGWVDAENAPIQSVGHRGFRYRRPERGGGRILVPAGPASAHGATPADRDERAADEVVSSAAAIVARAAAAAAAAASASAAAEARIELYLDTDDEAVAERVFRAADAPAAPWPPWRPPCRSSTTTPSPRRTRGRADHRLSGRSGAGGGRRPGRDPSRCGRRGWTW
ncbi:response regulator transcription factor [Dactylosporangium sp. NPDC051541]|uniref:response regulator transcription factor n=1 Tax=Dactylosporangium sp. NPDC051541 TaxID=3363977 RepID=UPI0037AE3D4A